MVNSADNSLLGQQTEYVEHYAPDLLFPIARQLSRQSLALADSLPFYGGDVWTGYEVSWLNQQGKPQVAVAEFTIPCNSEFIVESKSFKLYLNSLNQTRYDSVEQLVSVLARDLSAVVGARVGVVFRSLNDFAARGIDRINGELIDDLPVVVEHYHPAPELLVVTAEQVEETLYSDLLKTNCPVTGQPDWASVEIRYRGSKMVRESLLLYIISFRQHQDFHEHCVERMFMDILTRCRPESLSVYARYTRRGGLDINPYRTTEKNQPIPGLRLVRQ
jgi:7-cyano-7-deazaguanine reductase